MTRLASSRIDEMRQLEADGLDRKQIARIVGCSPGRVTQIMGRKYIRASMKTKACWADMVRRCANPSFPKYYLWGGRGISVCERWLTFENFLTDMGESPPGMSLDRIDNNGNYEPGNCRWATAAQQLRNKRTNRNVTVNGVTKTVSEWASDLGCSGECIRKRLLKGMAPERAVSTPSARPR